MSTLMPGVHAHTELLPLRQMVATTGDFALAFARQELLDRLAKPGKYRIASYGRGGQILAAGELALAEAQVMLRQAYGAAIRFGTPTVHSYVDPEAGVAMVPVMFVRIDAPRAHAQQLREVLAQRGAQLKEVDLQRDRAILRAELELSVCLGMTQQVGELTDGAAQVLCWLLGYREERVAHEQR